MDPNNVEVSEQWQRTKYDQTSDWHQLRTDNFWERAYDSETDPDLRRQLANYDGVGWYVTRMLTPKELKGRDILLYFGGVGDEAEVFVNGISVGSYKSESEKTKSEPFEIQIDPAIDWDENFQTFCVRVANREGMGGLTGRVWLVSKER